MQQKEEQISKKIDDQIKKQLADEAPVQNPTEYESPEERLSIILKGINEAIASQNKSKETVLYKNAQDLYKSMTGEDLIEKATAAAKAEIESEGIKTVQKGGAVAEEIFKKNMEDFKSRQQHSAAVKTWELITEEERKQFGEDINLFISQMGKRLQDIRKDGLAIPEEVFYNMLASGYMINNIKSNPFNGKIRIPILITHGNYKFKTISKKDFQDLAVIMQNFFYLTAKQALEDAQNKKMSGSKARWHKRKLRKARELLKALLEKIENDKKQGGEKSKMMQTLEEEIRTRIQKQVENEAREALENMTEIGEVGVLRRLKDFENLEKETDRNIKKDIKNVEERLERDIQDRAKEGKRISSIIKKQVKKGKIYRKRMNYMKKAEEKVEKQQKNST